MVKLGDQKDKENNMIFAWILIVVLILLCSFLFYIIYLMSESIEQYEKNIDYYTDWYNKFITAIADADARMQSIDRKGSFSSDDEIGFAYQTIKECIDNLTEMGVITYDEEGGQTDSREEIQGQEEEE